MMLPPHESEVNDCIKNLNHAYVDPRTRIVIRRISDLVDEFKDLADFPDLSGDLIRKLRGFSHLKKEERDLLQKFVVAYRNFIFSESASDIRSAVEKIYEKYHPFYRLGGKNPIPVFIDLLVTAGMQMICPDSNRKKFDVISKLPYDDFIERLRKSDGINSIAISADDLQNTIIYRHGYIIGEE